ncbi:MAG: hypothetical protein AAGD25_31120 [Cyanobacteria bacterium P01_F01_bin.150]
MFKISQRLLATVLPGIISSVSMMNVGDSVAIAHHLDPFNTSLTPYPNRDLTSISQPKTNNNEHTTFHDTTSTGAQIYYIDGDIFRSHNSTGARLYFRDGNTIRYVNRRGAALLYLDGDIVRDTNSRGARLLYFDGDTIRSFNSTGAKLFFIDGNIIRYVDSTGARIFYIDGPVERWALVTALADRGLIPGFCPITASC